MKKNFYHKIGVAELLAAVIKTPETDRGQWILDLALDLEADNQSKAKTLFAKELIGRTKKGRKHASESGKKGAEKRWKKEPENNNIDSNPIKINGNPIASSRSSNRSRSNNSKPKEQPLKHIVPEWINTDSWSSFIEMRKKIKAAPTDKAIEMLISKLSKLHNDGHDVNVILDQSTMNCWKGVFPIKEDQQQKGGSSGRAKGNTQNSGTVDWAGSMRTNEDGDFLQNS